MRETDSGTIAVSKKKHVWNLDRIAIVLAAVATVGIVFDAVATYLAVVVFRVAQELNPLILWAADLTTFGWAMVLRVAAGMFFIFVFMFLIRKLSGRREKVLSVYALGLAALMLVILAAWHIYVYAGRLNDIQEYLTMML